MSNIFDKAKAFRREKLFRKLNPPISCELVEEIEKNYNFLLPIEYREFITNIGNGGILPIAEEEDPIKLTEFSENLGFEHIKEDFLLQDSLYYANTSQNHCPFSMEDFLTIKNRGYLQIASTESCNNESWLLIITGIRRGEIWLKDEYGLLRLPNIGFNEWLNLYLDNQLSLKVEELSNQERTQKKSENSLHIIKDCMVSKRCTCIKWNPPISIDEVRAFEDSHGITLPIEYVEFVTKIADGCSNFFATNSKKQGGTMFRLKDFSTLTKLGNPFFFDKNTEEIRFSLSRNFNRHHTIWESELFTGTSTYEDNSDVWACPEYSLIPGVLPFAVYNDTGIVGMNTQALLVLNGSLKGQIWKATKFTLIPDGECETLYSWMIRMMRYGVI